ncbi:hypothetical protein DL93DRAFT_2079304 [Clavulina sp. PMI_390]|nr:hypothetical protein DL93DRAFT_2079304 [Clavulina sp. PMI_390]
MITYLRWYYGSLQALKRDDFKGTKDAEFILKNRRWWQPWTAIYGVFMCCLILISNGVSVFYNSTQWIIATSKCDFAPRHEPGGISPIAKFITSYIPIPLFLLMFLSYKLVQQTEFRTFDQMPFVEGLHHSDDNEDVYDEDEEYYNRPIPRHLSVWRQARFVIGKCWYNIF